MFFFLQCPSPLPIFASTSARGKFRTELSPTIAEATLTNPAALHALLQTTPPPDHMARLLALADDALLAPVVTVCATRFAVENETNRFTLDLDVSTDMKKTLAVGVLESKTTAPSSLVLDWPGLLGLRTIKLSKFMWATEV